MLSSAKPALVRTAAKALRPAAARQQPVRRAAARASAAARARGMFTASRAALAPPQRFFTFEDVDAKRIADARAREEESQSGLAAAASLNTGHSPVLDCIQQSHTTYSVKEDQTLDEAAALMLAKKVSSLLVRNAKGRVAGLLTERDFLKTHLAHVDGSTAVSQVMTPRMKIIMATPDATLSQCLEIMLRKGIRNMPIYDPNYAAGKRVLGVVSIRALVRQIFLEQDKEISDLRGYITDSYSVESHVNNPDASAAESEKTRHTQ